jgi:ATP-dependent Clp protease ATP-binding subunit ClpC
MTIKTGDTLIAELDKEEQKIKFRLKEEPKKKEKKSEA